MDASREQKHKACDLCKRRKVRCSGREPCQNCLRSKERCVFISPHGRLANAERRAEVAIERCKLLEAAWVGYLPHISLESAVERVRRSPDDIQSSVCETLEPSADQIEMITFQTAGSPEASGDIDDIAAQSERLDQSRPSITFQDLEWDESPSVVSVADGIGSLSFQTRGTGYMGPQSGNALLRSLQPFYGSLHTTHDVDAAYWDTDAQLGEQTLRSSAFSSRCVDAYFKYYHHAYPVLHEGEFRAQWMGVLPKPRDGSWPVLYNVILALGARSGDFSRQNADDHFYQQARQHLSWDILCRGSLPLVQALTLLANYLQKRDRPNSGFTLLGAAMNMAQSLGLHREFPTDSTTIQAMEIRRRAWWTLFVFDAGARLTFGRPSSVLEGVNVSIPCNLDDGDLPADVEALPEPKDYTTVSSCLIWQVKLAKISNRVNQVLHHRTTPDLAAISVLDGQIQEWRTSLPKHMTERSADPVEDIFEVPRAILLWRSMHLRIVLHRPFILASIKKRGPLDLLDQHAPHSKFLAAATECVESITSLWSFTNARHGSLVWYACYWLTTAVLVHITCLLYAPVHASCNEWRSQIHIARAALENMSQYELTALRAVRIIDQLLCLVPTSPTSNFMDTNEHLRMEFAESWSGDWVDMNLYQESLGE